MKRVFLTGVSGLVGSFLLRQLYAEGFHIQALVRKNSQKQLFADLPDQSRLTWIEGDLSDVSLLAQSVSGCDWVVHSAALVSFAPRDRQAMFEVNVQGTANLVNVCLEQPSLQKFCFVSSVAALGPPPENAHLIDEQNKWDDNQPASAYAQSKYLAELEVWRASAEGLPVVIVNPAFVIGPGDWSRSSTQVFSYVRRFGTFYTDGYINYVDVRDVARLTYLLLMEPGLVAERFILCAGQVSYFELFSAIAQHYGQRTPSIRIPTFVLQTLAPFSQFWAWLTGNKPLISQEMAAIAQKASGFSNQKITKQYPANFIDWQDSVAWTCQNLMKK